MNSTQVGVRESMGEIKGELEYCGWGLNIWPSTRGRKERLWKELSGWNTGPSGTGKVQRTALQRIVRDTGQMTIGGGSTCLLNEPSVADGPRE